MSYTEYASYIEQLKIYAQKRSKSIVVFINVKDLLQKNLESLPFGFKIPGNGFKRPDIRFFNSY